MADRKPQALPVSFQVAEDKKSATWQKNIVEYDEAQYLAGKKLTAYEWNALFVRIVKQGNHTADSLKAFIEGTLPTLLEAYDTTLRGLITELSALIGSLSDLTTDQKNTIISAINEVDAHADANKAEIGTLNALTTDEKATLVGAINEVDNHADNAQQDAEAAQTTANSATTLANTGISKAEQAQVTANSAVDKAESALDRANKAYEKASDNVYAVGFMTLEEAITALNGYDNTVLKTNDNIIVVAQGSPDLYVTGVEATNVPYHFTTVDKFNDDLVKNTVLQIGYYKVAFYETNGQPVTVAYQNVAVKTTDWVASTEFADFPYAAKIELSGFVDYKTVPQVVFDIADTMSGNYAPICKSGDKCVYIYGKVQNAITLKTVITFAPNVNGASVTGGGYTNKGKWVASTTYEIDDLVYTDKGQYVCIEGITSTTSPDNDTTHWQATFVATAGTTKNTLRFSGQNTDGSAVQKTFDGSTPVEVSFDETTMTTKEVDGVLKVGAKGTIPEALPQTAGALKSGNLPTSGWEKSGFQTFWEGNVSCPSSTYKLLGTSKELADILYADSTAYVLANCSGRYMSAGDKQFSYIVGDVSSPAQGKAYRMSRYSSDPTIVVTQTGDIYAKGDNGLNTEQSVTYKRIGASTNPQQFYSISDASITANSDILMELTDDGGVKAYSMEAGKMTVIRDTVPTQPIPYTYKVKQTNASGQFTLVNHFVPNAPAIPIKTSQLENDSGFITQADIPTTPTSLPVTYKKVSGELSASGWSTSDEGWKENTLPASRYWGSVVYGDGKYVATANGSDKGAYSTDGISWTEMSMPASLKWYSVTYGNGKFVAIASETDKGAYSADGITWTEMSMPASRNWRTITYGNGKFVAMEIGSDKGAYSTDGITWTEFTLPATRNWMNVTYGDGKFVAMAYNQYGAYSTDGINWVEMTLPVNTYWAAVTYGNGKFVAVASNSSSGAYSVDGINWTETTLPASAVWGGVTYGNGKFVTVAFNSDKSAYSTDGINWTETSMPVAGRWQIPIYGNEKFVVMLNNSDKGAYWKAASSSTGKTYSITDTFITANSSVKMYLTYKGDVKAQSKENGKITVICDTAPTEPIPYEYEVERTSVEGLFKVINAYIPSAGAWSAVDSNVALTEAGTYVILCGDTATELPYCIYVYWDGSTSITGQSAIMFNKEQVGNVLQTKMYSYDVTITESGTILASRSTVNLSNVDGFVEQGVHFKYRKIN